MSDTDTPITRSGVPRRTSRTHGFQTVDRSLTRHGPVHGCCADEPLPARVIDPLAHFGSILPGWDMVASATRLTLAAALWRAATTYNRTEYTSPAS